MRHLNEIPISPARLVVALLAIMLALLAAPAPAHAVTTYTVNTTSDTDDGVCDATHCSLREAINAANVSPGQDTMLFDIGTGHQVIVLESALPDIVDTLWISGRTQTGYVGSPLIEISGSLNYYHDGLVFTRGADGSSVDALIVNGLGAEIRADSISGFQLTGSYVGIDWTGEMRVPGDGTIEVLRSTNVVIGGDSGNVIAGGGVLFQESSFGEFLNNRVGTNADGTSGHGGYGLVFADAHDVHIADNVLSGGSTGIRIVGLTPGIENNNFTIVGNRIGTNTTGSVAIGNRLGIEVIAEGTGNHIGGNVQSGNCDDPCNVVSGNDDRAIAILGRWEVTIEGNRIGTDASGDNPIPNGLGGISVASFGQGTATISRNVIAGNFGAGLRVSRGSFVINENLIGVAADGLSSIANMGDGVYVDGMPGPVAAVVGSPQHENVIAHNLGSGVVVVGNMASATIAGNSVHSNRQRGIDNRNGGNLELTPPIFSFRSVSGASGMTCPGCTVELFADDADQGREYLGSVFADQNGHWSYSGVLDMTCVTATVTRTNATSEFSFVSVIGSALPNNDSVNDLSPPKPFDDRTVPNSDPNPDFCDPDDDNDGLLDSEEAAVPSYECALVSQPLDPLNPDTDGDNILDGSECEHSSDPGDFSSNLASPPCGSFQQDSDGDGLSEAVEICYYRTDPTRADTNGNGCSDGQEVASVNGDRSINVLDLQQVASEAGTYQLPASKVKAAFDLNKNRTIDVVDLRSVAFYAGRC